MRFFPSKEEDEAEGLGKDTTAIASGDIASPLEGMKGAFSPIGGTLATFQ